MELSAQEAQRHVLMRQTEIELTKQQLAERSMESSALMSKLQLEKLRSRCLYPPTHIPRPTAARRTLNPKP
jgi:hypothetical protein